MADKYYITGDINTTNKNYGEKRVEIGGGGDGVIVLSTTREGTTTYLSMTWNEIKEAVASGKLVVLPRIDTVTPSYAIEICTIVTIADGSHVVGFISSGATDGWFADTEDAYPSQSDEA